MSDDVLNAIVLIGVFLTYVVGLLLVVWRLFLLYIGYRAGLGIIVQRPRLNPNDRLRSLLPLRVIKVPRTKPPLLLLILIIFIGSIAWPWVLLFGVRVLSQVFGWDTSALSGNTFWYLVTGVPPDLGVLLLLWITYRVIERDDKSA